MAIETRKSYCRICPAYCAIEVEVEDNRVLAVRGDASDPVTGGYTCLKGRRLPAQMESPARLRASQKRGAEGRFRPISSQQALDEIARRLQQIIAAHGPRAVASYCGTCAFYNAGVTAVVQGWHHGIGSPSYYTSLTIDQSAKVFAVGRIGLWGGGTHTFASSDVALVVGNNPPVSHLAPPSGVPGFNPIGKLNEARRRGLKLICVDPRRTELARRADLHLQIRPGEDPTLLAGLLRVILQEGLHDVEFCNEHVEGLETLRESVADFTPDYVAERSGVPVERMLAAARLFGKGPRGCATSGTGPDMAPHPNLSEHLISVLNLVCGRVNRAGDQLENPGVLGAAVPRSAQAIPSALLPPMFQAGCGPGARVRPLQRVCDEIPTAVLAEEILTPGEGQVRALICVGGNPVLAWPDQRRTLRALEALDLLVCVDPRLTPTAELAHYVIAPKLPLEREDVTLFADMFYEQPYAHYTRAVVEPDPDAIDDWEVFLGLAKRMGTRIELPAGELPLEKLPDKFALLAHITQGSRVPLERVREHNGGHLFEELEVFVEPPIPGIEARLSLAPDGIPAELREVRAEPIRRPGQLGGGESGSHLLICRRMPEVMNSLGQELPESRASTPTNPAYMNPSDLTELGVAAGEVVEIRSEIDAILAVVEASDELQPGVISMAHSWGKTPQQDDEVREIGSNVGRLIAADRHLDPLTGMPRQSAIPVTVRKHGGAP